MGERISAAIGRLTGIMGLDILGSAEKFYVDVYPPVGGQVSVRFASACKRCYSRLTFRID